MTIRRLFLTASLVGVCLALWACTSEYAAEYAENATISAIMEETNETWVEYMAAENATADALEAKMERAEEEIIAAYEATADAEAELERATQPRAFAPVPVSCVPWWDAYAHIGEQTCVEGIVTWTYDSGRAFFIDFTSDRRAFYGVSFDYVFYDLVGQCVRLYGLVETYEGRPEIIIRDQEQVRYCP